MKTIEYGMTKYQIPENWNEITVRMLIKADELAELLEEAELIAVISAYTNIPVNLLRMAKIDEVNKIIEIMKFLQHPYQPKPTNRFHFRNAEYKAKDDLTDHNFEDWVSLQTVLYNNKENPLMALPKLIAILCKKEKEDIDSFSLKERAELFMDLPMTIAKDIEAFFLSNKTALEMLIRLSSTQNIQKEIVLLRIKELRNTMKQRKAQLGIFSFTRFRIGIYLIQLWWVRKQLEKYYNLQSIDNSKKTSKQTLWKSVLRKLKPSINQPK